MTTSAVSFNASDVDHARYSNELHSSMEERMFERMFERSQHDDKVADLVGKDALTNFGLLILERCSHGSGDAYEHRYFAVRFGKITLTRGGDPDEIVISDRPSTYTFLDCNGEYSFKLPEGGMEYVNGEWVPNNVAKYDY